MLRRNGSDDTRFTELGRDVGKELPRTEPVVCMLFAGSKPKNTGGNLPSMHTFRGYLRDNHCSTNVLSTVYSPLFASRVCDTVETGLI